MTSKRYSKKREAILECIRSTDTHPSAEWVYSQLKEEHPGLSLGTVYRNISLFKAEGTVLSIGAVDGIERFDGNMELHAHFICQDCGAVIDVDSETLRGLDEKLEARYGVVVRRQELTFCGQCKNCNTDPP